MRPVVVACALLMSSCAHDDGGGDDPNEAFSGGDTTVFDVSRTAFAQAAPTLSGEREEQFFLGNAIFNRGWVTAPASTSDQDGLGPLFNATNCSACHLKDGRGRPPVTPDEAFSQILLRLSIPGVGEHGAPAPEPRYGGQLQDNAVRALVPEGRPRVTYSELPGTFADGEPYSLRVPSYSIDQLVYGPLAPELLVSPRVAPAVFGLGLLEAISEQTLESLTDPDDRDGDGISGRINHVWNARLQTNSIGRFGWKANEPTIAQQTTAAFQGDIGITSRDVPTQNCTPVQVDCSAQPSGAEAGGVELLDAMLSSVVDYMHTLAVPARRDLAHPDVMRGRAVFLRAGCASCHVPRLETGELAGFPELSHQVIRPFTDLLLHDMGPALADGRPDFEASGSEWRTPPLWGIGLVQRVNQHAYFLHDGRARGLLEAVLFHGGEATSARDAILAAPREDRVALIAFMESL